MIDPAQVISLELAKRDRAFVAQLESELSAAHRSIGELVALLKDAHRHVRDDALAILIGVTIRDFDAAWKPKLRVPR